MFFHGPNADFKAINTFRDGSKNFGSLLFPLDENGDPIKCCDFSYIDSGGVNFWSSEKKVSFQFLYLLADEMRDWEFKKYKDAGCVKRFYKKRVIQNPYLANTVWYSVFAAGVASVSYGVHKLSKKETRKKMKEAMHNVVKRFSKQVEKHANKLNPSVSVKAPRITS